MFIMPIIHKQLIGLGGLFVDEYNPYTRMKKIIIAH
jgi:hypothetical protein